MTRARIIIAALLLGVSTAAGVTPRDANGLGDLNTSDNSAPSPVLRGRPAEQEPAPRPSGNPLWSIPLGELRATLDRPIFSPSRRPVVPTRIAPQPQEVAPPLQLPPPAPDEPVNLVLIGTVANGVESIAVFVDPATRNAIRLRVGEAYNGWVLREIHGRDASMEKGDRIEPVSMPRPDL